jgi:hypothetical protein
LRLWLVVVVALAGPAVAATALATSAPGSGAFRPGPNGLFVAVCGFTHRNEDDVIVFPNQPGRSHDHSYFGNATASAASTPESLRAAGATTCSFLGDTAAYWVPTLFADGRAVDPFESRILYVKATFGNIAPFPADLKVIAGDAQARSPQSERVVSWSCTPGGLSTSVLPVCPSGSERVLRVTFPNCWDGLRLDSADHKSHMAYSADRVCPASHPVAVPELQMVVRYPAVSGQVELSSGGRLSAHADFVNAWDQELLEKWVDVYLNRRPSSTPVAPSGDPASPPRVVLKLWPQMAADRARIQPSRRDAQDRLRRPRQPSRYDDGRRAPRHGTTARDDPRRHKPSLPGESERHRLLADPERVRHDASTGS